MAVFTWGTIKDWNGDDLNDTLRGLAEDRRKAMDVHDSIGGIDVKSGWEGQGARAAGDALGRLKDSCAHHLGLIGDLIEATSAAQDGVNEVKTMVAEIRSLAEGNGLTIGEDGSVQANLHATAERESVNRVILRMLQPIMKECAEFIERACKRAAEVDSAYTSALAAVSEGRDSNPEGFDDLTPGLSNLPKEGASTEEVAAWWRSLTEKERKAILKRAKDEIAEGHGHDGKYAALGNMDGIMPSARTEINEARFRKDFESIESLKKRKQEILDKAAERGKAISEVSQDVVDNYGSPRTYLTGDEIKEIDSIDTKCSDLESINDTLKKKYGEGPNGQTHLYLYDPANGQPGHEMTHAAVAVGDLDNADHVATYVPGKDTTVHGSLGGMTDQMARLKERSETAADGKSVATIGYIGYDCPQSFPEAKELDRAQTGGQALTKHLEGIADARAAGGQELHQSVIGHSFGSTTSSYGVKDVRDGVVQDYVVMGSPGVAGTASEMKVPEGHTYAMGYRAYVDYESTVNPSGRYDPMILVDDIVCAPNGADPEGSGGFTSLDPGKPEGSGSPHSAYLTDGSPAQTKLADIIAGKQLKE